MHQFQEIEPFRAQIHKARVSQQSVGFIPTMGALHEGHLTLVRRSLAENDLTCVSIFINPTQFNDIRDFERYPRTIDRDLELLQSEGVDVVFIPNPREMYPDGFDTVVVVRALSDRLEGASRPSHFQGVSTVVTKLLNVAQSDRAYFGQKDWQQLQIIKRLATDLNIPTEIVGVETVREPDGLAMSSRNTLLTPEYRKAASVLSSALSDVALIAGTGVHDAYELAAWLHQTIAVQPLAKVDYAVVVDAETLQEIDTIERGAIAAVAANFGNVRLIDNRYIGAPTGPVVRR